MAKKQKKIPVQKRTGTVALLSLFCAAAGVYAADTTDGWSYNAETATIEHNGESTFPRTIKKGNQFNDGSTIGSVSNVKVSGSATMGGDGVVFDGGEAKTGTLAMEEGAVLDSKSDSADGMPEDITTVKFEDGVKGKIDAAGATISAESNKDATAISGGEIESITAKEISAKTVDTENSNATAIDATNIGSVNIDKVVGDIKVGQIKDITIGELDGNLSAGTLGDSDSKDAKISLNVNEEKEIRIENIVSEATIKGNSTDAEKDVAFVAIKSADKKLTLAGKVGSSVGNASEGLAIDNVNGSIELGDTTAKLGENALEVKGTLDGDLNSFGTISGNVDIDTINGNTTISALDGDLTAKTLGKSELEEGETRSETNITISASDKGNRTIGIDTINGNATISMDDTDGSMTIEKIGQVNGDLTVNDYAKIKNIENVDGKLTLEGSDKQATAKVGYAKELDANADGLTDVDTADTVHLKGEKLSLKGQTVKSESENSRTTIADLGKDETIGSVIVGDVKLDGSIDGFTGNLPANSTDDVNIENGYTGNIDIKEVRDADGNPAGDFRSDENAIAGDVKLGTVGNVEVNGGIAANGEAANGNLDITTANGDVTVNGTIAGNLKVENANGNVSATTVGGDMTVGLGGGTVSATEVGGTATITGEGTFDIANAGGLDLGNAGGKLTITDNNLILSESSNLNSALDEEGNAKSTTIASNGTVKVDTLDKETTIDGFEGNLSVGTTKDINVGDKGLTGNLTVDNVDGKLASSENSTITGDVKLGTVGNVELNGGIAANGEAANGNLDITTANGDVTVNGTIAGNLKVENANGNVSATTVGGDMTVGLGGGTVSATEVGGTATITGEGTFDIANAGGLDLGNAGGKLTITDNNLILSESSNLNSALDEEGNAKSTTIASNGTVKVGTLDKTATIDGFNGNLEAANTSDINVGDKGLTGNLTVGTVNGKLASTGKIDGDVAVEGSVKEIELGGDVNNISVGETLDKTVVTNVKGDMTVGKAGGDITVKDGATVDGKLEVGDLGGNIVSADKAGSVVAGGTGNVKVDNAGSLAINGDAGSLMVDGNKVSTNGDIKVSGKTDGKMNIDIDGSLSAEKVSQASEIKGFEGDVIIENASATVTVDGKKTNITVGLDGADGNDLVLDVKSADTVKISGGNSGKGEVKIADANLDTTDLGALKTTITGQELEQVSADGNIKIAGTLNDNAKLGTTTDATVDGFKGSLSIDNALASTGGNVLDVINGVDAEITVGNENSTPAEGAQGNVNVEGDIKKIDVKFADKNDPAAPESSHELTVSGNAEEARVNNGNATINTVGNLTAFDEAGENVRLTVNEGNNIVIERDVIDQITGDVRKTQTVTAKVSDEGSLTVKDLDVFDNAAASFTGDITVMGDAKDFTIGSVNNLEFNNGVDGDLTIGTSVKSITAKDADGNLKDITGTLNVAQNTGEINVGTVGGNATFGDAQGNVTTGDIEGTLNVAKNTGEINVGTVGGNATFGNAQGNVTTGDITGALNVAQNTGEINVGNVGGNATFGDAQGKVTTSDITGALEVTKNTGEITVGNVGGKMTLGDAQDAVVADSANGVDATLNVGSLTISGDAGDVNLKGRGTVENIAESSSLTFTGEFNGQAQFGTISGDVNANGNFVEDLTIGTVSGAVNLNDVDKLVIEHATGGENANVTVGQVNESLNVKLENDTNLFVKGTVLGTATVNGGCDATFEQYAENVKVTEQLNGLLDIQNGVNNLEIKNVEQLKVGTVDGLAKFLGDGEITIVDNGGVVTRFENGLEALDSGKIKVENEIVVADNKAIEAAGRVIEANKMISFEGVNAGEDGVVLRAAKLTGTSAKDIVDALYKDAYGIGADGEESLTKYTLVGDHGDIDGKIAADISEIPNKSLNDANLAGEYRNGDHGKVVFNVSKNSFFENRATSENEKAFAQVLDSAEYTGNDASDERAVAVKRNYYNLAQNGGFASALPQAVSRAARMNMDLANIVHLDTINRTSATRDMLNAYGKKLNEFGRSDSLVRGTSFVTVRNINRFASYGGDSYASGSNDYIYGGLVNAEYIVNEDLFAGLGVGGFQAKSSGKDNSGKAETQSFALNLYGDYAFYDGFDWYFGATYAFGMNKTDRQRGAEIATSDWNSNLVGVFSGVRYTWKPFEDQSIAIKPLVGVNANFLLNPSYDEDAGGLDKLSIEERDYSSFKTIVGVEAVKAFDFGLSVAARMFYTHEFADNSYNVGATLSDSYRTYGSFVYRGYEMDRDSGIFGIGLGYDINPDWRVYLDYAAEVSGDVYHNLNAGVQLKF